MIVKHILIEVHDNGDLSINQDGVDHQYEALGLLELAKHIILTDEHEWEGSDAIN